MPKSKEQHLTELPKKKSKIMNLVWVVIMVLGLFLSINVTNTHISVLFNNFSQFTDIFVQMCHPDWGYAATAVPLLAEMIKMVILGTMIGSVIAFIYSPLIARSTVKNKIVAGILRVTMNIVRTIPDLLLGAVFVAIVGIGPVASVLALSVFTFGVAVKLLYEAIETIDPGPIEALITIGANKLQITHSAVMPQIITYFTSYVLYAFEISVRASAVLGYIGAGGIGLYSQQTLQVFDYAKTGLTILITIVVVVLIDYVSTKSRGVLMK